VDPKRLLVLREVARAGSLSGAARELGWTQPAVAQHVRRLERDTGTPLVLREGRGVVLTEAALVLVRHADAVADRLAAAASEVEALRDLRRGRVSLAAFPSASSTLVPRALVALAERHPGLDVRLAELEPPEALAALMSGEVDLAVVFRYADSPQTPDELRREVLLEEPVRLVLPRGRRSPKGLAGLAGERWIAGCARCRTHLLTACRDAGFEPDVRFETDDYVVTQELVASGLGVSLLPDLALRAVRLPGVRAVDVPGLGTRRVELVLRPSHAGVPAVVAAGAALAQAARRL
jgi:molybdate transport repressor ModE-like protein